MYMYMYTYTYTYMYMYMYMHMHTGGQCPFHPQMLVARKLDDPRQGSCPDLCRQAVRYASSSPAADLAGGPSEALRPRKQRFFSPTVRAKKHISKYEFHLIEIY